MFEKYFLQRNDWIILKMSISHVQLFKSIIYLFSFVFYSFNFYQQLLYSISLNHARDQCEWYHNSLSIRTLFHPNWLYVKDHTSNWGKNARSPWITNWNRKGMLLFQRISRIRFFSMKNILFFDLFLLIDIMPLMLNTSMEGSSNYIWCMLLFPILFLMMQIDQKGWKKTLKVANSIHDQAIGTIKYSKYFMLRMIIIDVKFDGFTKATAKIIYCSRTHSQIAQVYSPTTKKDNWIGLKGIEEHSLSTSMCYCWKPYSILY